MTREVKHPMELVDQALLDTLLTACNRAELTCRKFLVHGDRDLALMQAADTFVRELQAAAAAVEAELGAVKPTPRAP